MGLCSALLIAVPGMAVEPDIRTLIDDSPVSASAFLQTLTEKWLTARLEADQSITLWNSDLRAQQDGTLLALGLNSEFIFAAVLQGQADSEAGILKPGDVMLLRHLAATPARKQIFSAREVAQKFRDENRPDLAQAIDDVVDQQRKKRFWGLLRPTNISVGTPIRAEVEQVRGTYARAEPLIRIKRSIDEVQKLPRAVAIGFLEAIRDGDTQTAAALLTPVPFRESARQGRLKADREYIARQLATQQEWASQYRDHSLFATPDPLRFIFLAGQQPYHIYLTVFDNGVFVERVAPISTQDLNPQPEGSS